MERKDLDDFIEQFSVMGLQGLEDLKGRPDILERIRFDVTPRMIMEPRLDPGSRKDLAGCFFYIETFEPPPALMLMKVNRGGVTTTIGRIDAVPAGMLERAIGAAAEPPVNMMYAITEEIRDWLAGELGL